MKLTTNYNLYKPDYDDTIDVDFLNQNMDVLDAQLNNLDYVQNVNTSDNGLTFIKRDNTQINVPLNYLPLTGGNINGTLSINNKEPIYIVERLNDVVDDTITLESIKYSDGRLTQNISVKYIANVNTHNITFLTPFKDTTNISVSIGTFALNEDSLTAPHNDWTWSITKIKNTGCIIQNVVSDNRFSYTINGYWK